MRHVAQRWSLQRPVPAAPPAGQLHKPLSALHTPTCSSREGHIKPLWSSTHANSFRNSGHTRGGHGDICSWLGPHLVAVEAAGLVATRRRPGRHLCLRVVLNTPGAQRAGAPPLYVRRHRPALALLLLLLLVLLHCLAADTAVTQAASIAAAT